MEFMLFLWDELDDWTAACRHVTASALSEVSELSVSLTAALSTFVVWLSRTSG